MKALIFIPIGAFLFIYGFHLGVHHEHDRLVEYYRGLARESAVLHLQQLQEAEAETSEYRHKLWALEDKIKAQSKPEEKKP